MFPPWDMVVFPAVAALLAGAAVVQLARRRWRAGMWLLASGVLTLAGHAFWTGHVFLRSDWSEPFLRW